MGRRPPGERPGSGDDRVRRRSTRPGGGPSAGLLIDDWVEVVPAAPDGPAERTATGVSTRSPERRSTSSAPTPRLRRRCSWPSPPTRIDHGSRRTCTPSSRRPSRSPGSGPLTPSTCPNCDGRSHGEALNGRRTPRTAAAQPRHRRGAGRPGVRPAMAARPPMATRRVPGRRRRNPLCL